MEQTYVKIERENQISGWVTTVRVERDKCPGEGREVRVEWDLFRFGQMFRGMASFQEVQDNFQLGRTNV